MNTVRVFNIIELIRELMLGKNACTGTRDLSKLR